MIQFDGWAESALSGQVHEHMDTLEKLICNYNVVNDLAYLEEKLVACLNYIYALKVNQNG